MKKTIELQFSSYVFCIPVLDTRRYQSSSKNTFLYCNNWLRLLCTSRGPIAVQQLRFHHIPRHRRTDRQNKDRLLSSAAYIFTAEMPFAQLVLGSPGAGKSTYCNGSMVF
jgi:hypothetical protein